MHVCPQVTKNSKQNLTMQFHHYILKKIRNYVPLLADLAMAFAAHILTSGRVGMMASPGGGSSFSDSSFLPEENI